MVYPVTLYQLKPLLNIGVASTMLQKVLSLNNLRLVSYFCFKVV